MSTFLIPTTLGEEMEWMINSIWWDSNIDTRRGINWLSWDKLTMRNEFGGMSFRNFHSFNLVMLGKQDWRLSTNKDAIVKSVFKAKYCLWGDFLGARLGYNSSYVWCCVHTSQVLVSLGARWKVGSAWVEYLNLKGFVAQGGKECIYLFTGGSEYKRVDCL